MKFAVLRLPALIMLLSACSQGCATSSTPIESLEPEQPPTPQARLSVERHSGYGDDWDAAYDVVLDARLQAFARLGVTRVVLAPHAVEGRIFPHIIRVTLHFGDGGDSKSIIVVAGDQILESTAGPDGLTAVLAGLDVPRQLPPAALLTALACYFQGTIAEREAWCSAVGEAPRAEARVEASGEGALLVLERELAPASGGSGSVPHRLEIRFDTEARATIRQFHRGADGAWQAEPLD